MCRESLKQRLLFYLATRLGWLFILFWGKLTRIEYIGREHYIWLKRHNKPFIFCIWHGRILLPIYIHRFENIQAMVSEHRDGEMIAQTLQRLGYRTVRGSSTRGARKASIQMIRSLKKGAVAAIMPDGPRGPRHRFKAGAAVIAQKAGAYLLLMTFASSSHIQFRSWDRFYLWKPFSRSVVLYSEPIFVPPELEGDELDAFIRDIERRMIEQEMQADAHFRT